VCTSKTVGDFLRSGSASLHDRTILRKKRRKQRAFLLKKWRKNGEKNAKNIERSAGSLGLLHNP
jgi:hypothetical protein